jgi:hypothetical protein
MARQSIAWPLPQNPSRNNLGFQNRERTGIPARAARVGWWRRPDQRDTLEKKHTKIVI